MDFPSTPTRGRAGGGDEDNNNNNTSSSSQGQLLSPVQFQQPPPPPSSSQPTTTTTTGTQLKFDQIPTLKFENQNDHTLIPPPPLSPNYRRSSIVSATLNNTTSPQNFYRQGNNDSNTSLQNNKTTSLNYVPSFAQPPPINSTNFLTHSPSNSQSSLHSASSSLRRSRSPIRAKSPIRSPSPIRGTSPVRNPFNYKSTTFMMHGNGSQNSLLIPGGANGNNTPNAAPMNKRRGHRYKHSSVSMNLFQEPIKRAPLNIPQSYSIPTGKEIIQSLKFTQKMKLTWCLLHISLIALNFILGLWYSNSLLLTLSHLCFYDVLSNALVVIVDIMTNFECWQNSSLQYPFGLGRIEVLVGFGLSVSLIFVGGDLISHIVEEIIINMMMDSESGSPSPETSEERIHHSHSGIADDNHTHLSGFVFEIMILLTIITTVISSNVLLPQQTQTQNLSQNQKTQGQSHQQQQQQHIQFFNKNYLINCSTNILTLAFASYSLVYPLISRFAIFETVNDLAIFCIAIAISTMAWKLIKSLSYILLISYPHDDKSFKTTIYKISTSIQDLEMFKQNYKLNKIIVSKVNYKIYIVILQIMMPGCSDEDESKMRFYTSRAIKPILTSSLSSSDDTKFEITIEIVK